MLKTLILPYDVTLIYALFAKCRKIQMPSQGKGSQIQINNETIIEFGSRRKRGIIKASVCVICLSLRLQQITQTSALIIPHILLNLIQ